MCHLAGVTCTGLGVVVESVIQIFTGVPPMPAARPRMQVTPTEKVYRLLTELSKLQGKPQATIVREILDEAAPALEMTIEAFRAIHSRPEEARAAVMRMASQAQIRIAQATLDLNTDKKPGRKRSGAKKPE